jgi:hypothetical protein
MSSVGTIEVHVTASVPRPSATSSAGSAPSDHRANAPSSDPASAPRAVAAPQTGAAEDQDRPVIDERTLDRMAMRLIKRDPGLSIEKDETVRGYIYRFFDPESGDQVGQFPADKVLETMRALHEISDRRTNDEKGPGVAV